MPPFHSGLDVQLAYLTELELESLIAASPLAKTLCEIKQALVNLQQPSDFGNAGNTPCSALHCSPVVDSIDYRMGEKLSLTLGKSHTQVSPVELQVIKEKSPLISPKCLINSHVHTGFICSIAREFHFLELFLFITIWGHWNSPKIRVNCLGSNSSPRQRILFMVYSSMHCADRAQVSVECLEPVPWPLDQAALWWQSCPLVI